jgi:exopolyphosphatase/guanosine-5'-triphosphate,3'-diphosphate pyrophosphatase
MTASPASPSTLAAIDIGTNSFHLVVARHHGAEGFEILTREKEMVRLGHGGSDMKDLAPEAIDRGVATLRRMRRIADSYAAPIRAVATSATREAANAATFIERARTEAGVEIDVISGIEEARLIQLGILQTVPVFDKRMLLVDIGGGSTEVLVGERGEPLAARSFKLGAVRLTDRFFPGGVVDRARAVEQCRKYVRSTTTHFRREVRKLGFDVAVASSGTAEAVAAMVAAKRGVEPRTFNCFELSRSELAEVTAALARRTTPAARAKVPGLDAARADIALAGAIILDTVADMFGITSLTFSEGALREGVLLDTVARLAGGSEHVPDVARRSIRQLVERCDDDPSHSAHVARLALQLFEGLRVALGLDDRARDQLEAAALLANVGLVIAHSKHHLHSYYVIRNSELTGLTDREIELIAQIARYHRKSAPKASHPEFAALEPSEQHLVRVLAAILRIAIGLDRSHDRRVQQVSVERRRGRVVVHVGADAGRDIGLELYAANERSSLLAEVLGAPVDVRATGHPALSTTPSTR